MCVSREAYSSFCFFFVNHKKLECSFVISKENNKAKYLIILILLFEAPFFFFVSAAHRDVEKRLCRVETDQFFSSFSFSFSFLWKNVSSNHLFFLQSGGGI